MEVNRLANHSCILKSCNTKTRRNTVKAKKNEISADNTNSENAIRSDLGLRIASSNLPVDKIESIALTEIKSAR